MSRSRRIKSGSSVRAAFKPRTPPCADDVESLFVQAGLGDLQRIGVVVDDQDFHDEVLPAETVRGISVPNRLAHCRYGFDCRLGCAAVSGLDGVFQLLAGIGQQRVTVGAARALQAGAPVSEALHAAVGVGLSHRLDLAIETPDELSEDHRHFRVVAELRHHRLAFVAAAASAGGECGGRGIAPPSRRRSLSCRRSGRSRNQLCAIDRVWQVFVAAGFLASCAVVRHGIGGQGEDRSGIAAVAEQAGCLVAVHLRHVHVHQDHVERVGFGFGDGQPAVLDAFDLGAGPAQDALDEFPIVVAVLGQQDAHSLEILGRRRIGIGSGVLLRLGRALEHADIGEIARGHGQREGAALSPGACHGQFAAEQMGDLMRDRQSQARAAEFSGDRCLALDERVEQLRKGFRADADSRVDHLDSHGRLVSAVVGHRTTRRCARRLFP